MSENKKDSEIFSFMIPMLKEHLLIPSETVAEVVPFMNVSLFEGIEHKTDWHIGTVAWRKQNIPVLSLERLLKHQELGDLKHSRVAIIHTLRSSDELPYIALLVQGIPRMVPVSNDNVEVIDDSASDLISKLWLKVGDNKAMVPDIDMLEQMAMELN